MNRKFLKLLSDLGWREEKTDFVKVFEVGGKRIPVTVIFYENNDGYPKSAYYTVEIPPETQMNRAKRVTELKGQNRIICCLDEGGLLAALKFLLYHQPAKAFAKQAKQIIYDHGNILA